MTGSLVTKWIEKFLQMDQSRPLFVNFCSFQHQFHIKIVDYRGIQTRIVGVEGEFADHLTTNTAQINLNVNN